MAESRVVVSREGPVARIVINRPEVRNALDEAAVLELTGAFRSLAADEGVRAALLSGAGPDFCAGADISAMRRAASYGKARNRADARRLVAMCRSIDEAPFPVVALVQGGCYGAGLGLIAAADIVAASEEARFCFSEVRLGILPAVVSTFVLPKIGASAARRWFLTAEVFQASAAREAGLVHEVVSSAGLQARGSAFAAQISKNGPRAVREAKALIRTAAGLSRERRLALTVETLARVRATPEAKEGLGAFLEKRPPAWAAPETVR